MIRGVKKRPSITPGGLKVVSVVYTPNHNKFFAIAKDPKRMGHSQYVVETLNKSGKFAKRQVRELYDRDFLTQGEAKKKIMSWDSDYEKTKMPPIRV